MMTKSIPLVLIPILLILLAVPVSSDGGFFSSLQYSVAVSADQRAIIAQIGNEIAMTLSTGYWNSPETVDT